MKRGERMHVCSPSMRPLLTLGVSYFWRHLLRGEHGVRDEGSFERVLRCNWFWGVRFVSKERVFSCNASLLFC